MRALAIGFVVLGLLVAAATLAFAWIGPSRWAQAKRDRMAGLDAARLAEAPPPVSADELDALPPVVQRFFRAVLPAEPRPVVAVTIEHRGKFSMSDTQPKWTPFTSTQRVTTRRPGFVWDARIRMAPGLAVHVHDAYVAGAGALHAALGGLVTLAKLPPSPALDEGELMRWFAETAWYPTALLPGQGVWWQALDERRATATMSDGAVTLTLTFTFAPEGPIESVRAEARGRTVGDRVVPTPWEGRWSGYERRDGLRVPTQGEVAWLRPEAEGGRLPYWRGTVTALRYEFAR